MEATGRLDRRVFRTDGQGRYAFRDFAFGHYRLEVSREGFAAQGRNGGCGFGDTGGATITLQLAQALGSKVDVVATTPLPGLDLPLDEIAAPVQTASQADLENSSALDLPDLMNRRLNGVHLNEVQGNPFQADLNFRGYTASPLLGRRRGFRSMWMACGRISRLGMW